MKRILVLILFLTFSINLSTAFAQSLYNGGHIPQASRGEWQNAGLLPGTPSTAANVFNVVSYGADTGDNNNDDYPGVLQALNAAKNASGLSVVFFPNGTYNINTRIKLEDSSYSNIVFRGEGMATVLKFNISEYNSCFEIFGSTYGPIIAANDILKGSNEITATFSTGDIYTNDWIKLYERDWPGIETGFANCVGQITQITSVNGNTGIMKDKANKAYTATNRIQEIVPIMNVGIENLKILRTNAGHTISGSNILFSYAVNCWVKGIESEKTCRFHVQLDYSSHIYVCGSYFHHSFYYDGGIGYGVCIQLNSTNCLIENNVFYYLRHAMVVQGGANGNVFTYNYSREQHWDEPLIDGSDLSLHGNYPYANLFEQNWVEYIYADDSHGQNGPYNTFIRNKVKKDNGNNDGWNEIELELAPSTNVLGCEIREIDMEFGSSLDCDFYGYYIDLNDPAHDTYDEGSAITHDNSMAYWNSLVLQKDVSYYYSSKPDFVGSYSWPSLGPLTDQSGYVSHCIPAGGRYDYTIKTDAYDLTTIPSLSVSSISGPSSLESLETGTFTVTASGGIPPYSYQWYAMAGLGGEMMMSSSGTQQITYDGEVISIPFPIMLAGGSTWEEAGSDSPTLNYSETESFKLKVEVTDSDNNIVTSSEKYVTINTSSAKAANGLIEFSDIKVPEKFSLENNYPNPFNPETAIKYAIPEASHVKLVVYNAAGIEITKLVNEVKGPGFYTAKWNAAKVASGVYFYKIETSKFTQVKKMILVK